MNAVVILITSIFLANVCASCAIRYFTKSWWLVWGQILIALITELAGHELAIRMHDTSQLYNVYVLAEVILLGVFGILQLPKGVIRYSAAFGWAIAIGCNVFQFFIFGNEFHATAFLVNCIFLTTLNLCIILFLQSTSSVSLLRQPLLYFCIGSVLYFGCDIPYFSLRSQLMHYDVKLTTALHILINNILASLRYLLTGLAFALFLFNHLRVSRKKYR